MGDLAAGVLAGLAVAMPIGAVGSYLVGLAARQRFAVAVSAALGVASVDGSYAVLAALGGSGVHGWVQRVSGELSLASALVLALLAGHTVRTAVRRYRADRRPSPTQRAVPQRAVPQRAVPQRAVPKRAAPGSARPGRTGTWSG